jgi:hypothetical protein
VKSTILLSRIVLAAVCAACSLVHAEDARIPISGGGALVLPLPDGWRTTKEAGAVPTLSLTPASGPSFQVLVSPLVSSGGRLAPSSIEDLRSLVESAASNAKSQAVEKSLPLQELRSADVQGSYFSATDRAPKPGEFKYLTQGAVSVRGLPVTFTILSNDNSRAAKDLALGMLRAARRE